MKTHRILTGVLAVLATFFLTTSQARSASASIQLIDLGLSVKWADMNIDAAKTSDNGGFYAWGETATKATYTWKNYAYCSGTETTCQNIGSDISGIPDYDRACSYSPKMCLPTAGQWEELISQCTWKETTTNGVKGFNVTGPNGNTIFLPFSGCSYEGSAHDVGSSAYYWSANNLPDDNSKAKAAYLKSGTSAKVSTIRRRTGAAIRAVAAPVTIELVDLGLSVKWASMNIDAADATGNGGYYAWGETRTKGAYTWATYAWCSGTEASCQDIGSNISGILKYDRAKNYSAKVCLPTAEQWQELISKCTWKAATIDGVKGYNVTGPSGNSIFLPFSGCSYEGSAHDVGSSAYYWTANNESGDASKAKAAYVKSGSSTKVSTIRRRTGAAIRAVAASAPSGKQYALYNYRNDGDFNAWLNIDIDSITYSRIDTLGVEHDDIVVQEVWTPDSLYRIPMEAIDSIGFRAPAPVMRDGIFYLRDYHAAHTLAIDSLTLYFDDGIKADSLPSIGQVVLHGVFTHPYEEGFAGKVKEIKSNSNGIVVICEQVAIGDIFKRLVMIGKASSDIESDSDVKRARRGLSDPWVNIEDNDVIPIDLDEKSFEVFDGLFKVTSPYPKLTCTYYVYISELYYELYAKADLYHKDLTYSLSVTTDQLNTLGEYGKFFKALTSEQGLDSWLNEKFNNSLDKYLKEQEEEEKLAQEEILKKVWKTKKVDIPIIGNGVLNLSLMVAPMLKIKGKLEADAEFKTDAWQSMDLKISGITALPSPGHIKDFNASFRQDPIKSAKVDFKAKGTLTLGLTALLNINLIHRNVLYAGIGGEFGVDETGILDVTLLDTEQPDMNAYDRLKDTQIKISYYAKVHPEIGISPLDIFHLSGHKFDVFSKDYFHYIMPHFTEPALPKFGNSTWLNKNPLGFYTTASKDVFIPCHIGMRITDNEGKSIKEYTNTYRYWTEDEWVNTPLDIDISDLPRGASYKCYPTISFFGWKPFNAGPVHNFAVPLSLVASPKELTIPIDGTAVVEIIGGWDTFAVVISGDEEVASIVTGGNDGPRKITILGKKIGNSELQIEDRRTGEIVKVPIKVTNEDMASLQLSTTSLSLTPGSQGTVNVTSGSGSYDAVSNAKDVATVTVDGSKIIITAVSPGPATITVKDNQTQERAKIEVTVSDGQSTITVTPQIIDIGEVEVEEPVTRYVTISNKGDQPQRVKISLDDFDIWNGFSLRWADLGDNYICHTILPGDSYMTEIHFYASTAKDYSTKITITSENMEGWSFVVPLKAKSVEKPDDPSFHLSTNSIGVYVNDNNIVDIHNGSGKYEIINDYPDIVESDINGIHVAHVPPVHGVDGHEIPYDLWYITGKKVGHAVLKLKDEKTNEMLTLNVEVKQAPHLTLSAQSVELGVGETDYGIEIKAGSGWYDISIDNPEIASASKYYHEVSWVDEYGVAHGGTFLEIKGLKAGNAKVTVTDNSSGETAVIQVRVKDDDMFSFLTCPDDHHPHLIDLGLPSGTKWACCNVDDDASKQSPINYGCYYAWGETEEKSYYDWSTYTHCDGSSSTCHDLGSDIAGTQYDVAHVKWGGSWVMPSKEQQVELRINCTYEEKTVNGVKGGKFTSKTNGVSIFLPAAGHRIESGLNSTDSGGNYWSSTPCDDCNAYNLGFYFGNAGWYNDGRYWGFSVRPVSR